MALRPAEIQARRSGLEIARLLLPFGWMLAAVGYYGPWIAHRTAALTLTGSDMGEFVKFLPGVLDGSLRVVRQLFYLPPIVVALSIALLVGSRPLGFPWLLRVATLVLGVVVSFQLLPPAWSPASLMTAEFRLQPIALGLCWLALAGFLLLGRLRIRLTGLICCGLAAAAGALSTWQFLVVKPAIEAIYGIQPAVGWGCIVCLIGLAILAGAGATLALLEGRPNAISRHKSSRLTTLPLGPLHRCASSGPVAVILHTSIWKSSVCRGYHCLIFGKGGRRENRVLLATMTRLAQSTLCQPAV